MHGIILINAYAEMKEAEYGAERLKAELEKRGVQAEIRRNSLFAVRVENGIKNLLSGYDFCVFFDKDKYVLQGLEATGMRLFNCRYAIEACDDKMTTCLALAPFGIRMPKTLSGIFCFEKGTVVSEACLNTVEEELGYPLVVKECYGSRGTGVHLASNRAELKEIAQALVCTPHLFQQYIAPSYGKDVRVIVVGGMVLGAMLRQSDGDFRSNVALGGRGEKFALSNQTIQLCEKIAKALKLDYCGIDLLFDDGGEPSILCEVNSNAFFSAFERVTGFNVAGAYAEHIIRTMGEKQ